MLLMSTSGPLGRIIDLPSYVSICLRCLLAAGLLAVFCRLRGISLSLSSGRDFRRIVLISILLVAHWTTYFLALQLSNIAIGMLALFTYPVFTALIEPLLLKTKLERIHLLFGAVSLIGVSLLVPGIDFQNQYLQGLLMGLLSSLIYVFRNVLVKPLVQHHNAMSLMFYQLLIGGLIMSPVLAYQDPGQIAAEWPGILALAVITTAMGHSLFVYALNHYSATSLGIISTIQPIYGIIMGVIFLSEIPTSKAMLGGALILLTVVAEGIRNGLKSG